MPRSSVALRRCPIRPGWWTRLWCAQDAEVYENGRRSGTKRWCAEGFPGRFRLPPGRVPGGERRRQGWSLGFRGGAKWGWSRSGERAGLGGTGAHVFGDAAVSDGAWVFEQAKVFGEAEISGQARVFEYAQVFDNSRVADQASVYGSALVFSSSDSEYVLGMTEREENLYTPVFAPHDVARVWWTESNATRHHWRFPIDSVRSWLGQERVPAIEEWENDPRSSGMGDTGVSGRPTSIIDGAEVFSGARVWGESTILGTARIEGWVSGGSYIFADICQGYWLNDITFADDDVDC